MIVNSLDVNQQALIVLARRALWSADEELPEADWDAVEKLASEQGVFWMLYMGAKRYQNRIPVERIKAWRGALHAGVFVNDQLNTVQVSLLQWLNENKIRAAILKGTGCSMYYPYPDARPLGDIDLMIDQENMMAVGAYLEECGFKTEESEHPFHVAYYRQSISIEVHYEISEFPAGKGGREAREFAKNFLNEVKTADVNGMCFPTLSDSHQALMLLTHMERHMIIGGVGLRQLCDWAMFVNGSTVEHWEERTLEMLQKCGLLTYAKVITKVCVNYLGLSPEKAKWCMEADDALADAMIQDVFRTGSMGSAEEEHMTNLFFDRTQLGTKGNNRIKGLLMQINKLSYKHFPITKKFKVLLPVFWVYLPIRYFVRSMLGLRPKKNVKQLLKASDQRQKLYKALKLYETK